MDKFYEPMKDTAIRKHMYLEDKKFFDGEKEFNIKDYKESFDIEFSTF